MTTGFTRADRHGDEARFVHSLFGRRAVMVGVSRWLLSLALLSVGVLGGCAGPPGPPLSTPPAGANSAVSAKPTQPVGGSVPQPTSLAAEPTADAPVATVVARDPG